MHEKTQWFLICYGSVVEIPIYKARRLAMFSKRSRLRNFAISLLCLVIVCLSGALYVVARLERSARNGDFTIVRSPVYEQHYVQQSKHKFEVGLRNSSGSRIRVHTIASSCSCTSAVASKDDLQDGEDVTVSLEVDTGASRGSKTITVGIRYSIVNDDENSPKSPPQIFNYPISLNLNVLPDFEIEEQQPQLIEDGKQTISIIVKACAVEKVKVLSASANLPCARIVEITPVKQDSIYSIQIIYDPTLYRLSDGRCEIAIHTDSRNEPMHRHFLEHGAN